MVSIQILNKIIQTGDFSIIENNNLDESYFVGYEEEFNFIKNHRDKYSNVPDKETFLSNFPDFDIMEVGESDRYLVATIREECLYYKCKPVVEKMAELLRNDANAATEYMVQALHELQPTYEAEGTDIIAGAEERLQEFIQKKDKNNQWYFTTGFPELDELIHGFNRDTAEFIIIFARTNQGKSWVLEKMVTHIWQLGFDVGYISPEMDATNVGYRFDTLYKSFSNKGLMWSNANVDEKDYRNYINELSNQPKNKFVVATPIDFDRHITVSKLKNWVQKNNFQFLGIDGITYMSDERFKRGDTKTISLTNISEDLRLLSLELHIPIIVVVQSNRGGAKGEEDEGTPELENIRDSDGIAQNATKVISIRQNKEQVLEMAIKKNTFGSVGGKLKYQWNIDLGEFIFIPSYDDAQPREKTERRVKKVKEQYKDKEEVF